MLRDLLAKMKKTVLLVTHDLDEALYLADRIVLLDEGRVVANLEPGEFLASNDDEVRAYIRAFHRGERVHDNHGSGVQGIGRNAAERPR
jgi:osmoprotectant transport system ATP-binding protein